jgi:hypothetical protein
MHYAPQEITSEVVKKIGEHGMHCKENPIYIFFFWELRGLSHNFHIHVSVSYNIPRIGLRQTDPGNIYVHLSQIYKCRNWETEHYSSVLEITV